ncbi:MAG: phospho-N-acetylmuramoyl-pentapeptide-transferase [Candidatus Bipolaricaulota bacterium]
MIPGLAAALAAFALSSVGCWTFARWMRRRRLGQPIREEGPAHHQEKAGTPTMGGLVFLAVWSASAGLLSLWIPFGKEDAFILVAGLTMAAIGALDDLLKLVRRDSRGLTGWQKIGLTAGAGVGLFFAYRAAIPLVLRVPFAASEVALPVAALAALAVVVFLAATNAVNFTDGLDGLAAGIVILILLGFLALGGGNPARLLALVGALCGYLWTNAHPAGLMMGDAGSFGLGGVLAAVALSRGTAFVFPILAGVPVLEVLAVILQVASLRLVGRRLFRMSPLHHHFEASPGAAARPHLLPACAWPESKVVVRFWLAQAAFVALAVLAANVL